VPWEPLHGVHPWLGLSLTDKVTLQQDTEVSEQEVRAEASCHVNTFFVLLISIQRRCANLPNIFCLSTPCATRILAGFVALLQHHLNKTN
jgi:hypothetical protein